MSTGRHMAPHASVALTAEADASEHHRRTLDGRSGLGRRRGHIAASITTRLRFHRGSATATTAAHRSTGAAAATTSAHPREQTTAAAAVLRATAVNRSAAVLASKQSAAAAAATVAAAATGASATTAALTGVGFVVGAQQGNTDDREKHRDTKHNKSIHPRLLH